MIHRWRRFALSLLAASGGGLAWALCFGRQPENWLPWIALCPLLVLPAMSRPGAWGLLHGVTFWLVSIPWIVATLETYGGIAAPLAWLLLLLLALYLGAYHGALSALGAPLLRRGGAVALVGLPALWTALEWLRGVLFGGFPWNLAAYAWADVPGALPLTAWIGPEGLSFLLVLANTGPAVALVRRRWEPLLVGYLVPLLCLAVGGRWSRPEWAGVAPGEEVRIVQPNTPIASQEADPTAGYAKLMRMSDAACDRPGPLLVWPESATWPLAWERAPRLRRDVGALVARGCPVLLNTPMWEGQGVYNSVLLAGVDGPQGRYDKRRLVPWGEYVPLRSVLPFVGRLARNAGDFIAGTSPALLRWRREWLAVAICYEVTFPAAVAAQVRHGATLLVTVTNDAWYGDSWAPYQHYRAARFRAAENRRPLLRAALTGISGVVDAKGMSVGRLGVGEEGILRARIRGGAGLSPYTRAPWLPPLAAGLLAAFAMIAARREE